MAEWVIYRDNLTGELKEDSIGEESMTLELASAGAYLFPNQADFFGNVMYVTLVNPADPTDVEVVKMVARGYGTDVFTAKRLEWGDRVWPAGTKVSGRITADMLRKYPQINGASVRFTQPGSQNHFATMSQDFVLPVNLPPGTTALPTVTGQDGTVEVFRRTVPVQAGVIPTHDPGETYYHGDSVVPPSSTGYYYTYCGDYSYSQAVGNVTFVDDTPVQALDGSMQTSGMWLAVPLPVVLTETVGTGIGDGLTFVVTEVGFISLGGDASILPKISVGEVGNTTKFLNDVQVKPYGSGRGVLRYLVPPADSAEAIDKLVFSVSTMGTGGGYRGVFYYRGFNLGAY